MNESHRWWKEGVVYQIYPRSFQDSNGDGIGDLRGIISRLDYLKELGVDIIWLSPVYRSPGDDNGYDISDYQAIQPEFGTMEDFDELLGQVHARGMRLVMDLVVNHTSDEHPWFIESRKGRKSPYRGYYIWKEPRAGGPPNNWGSRFRGSAWQFDEASGMYYLHLYSPKQPDLNWENPALRREIYRMMDWWGKKGIDGFRMDVISMLSKDPRWPDGEVRDGNPYGDGLPYYANGPRIHEYLQEMNREVIAHYDWLTVGEGVGVGPQEALLYAGRERGELNMMFHFEHMELTHGPYGKWNTERPRLKDFRAVLNRWQKTLASQAWNSLFIENHDYPRAVSYFGDDSPRYRALSAKMLAACYLLMKGTPYIYQGQELGMTNFHSDEIGDFRDIEIHNVYRELCGRGLPHAEVMAYINHTGRDNARTPMQWSSAPGAGFSSGRPWIPLNPNYREINAADEAKDPDSVLNFYRALLALRRQNQTLQYGSFFPLLEEHPAIYAYARIPEAAGDVSPEAAGGFPAGTFLILANFTADVQAYRLPSALRRPGVLLKTNYPDLPAAEQILRPCEAQIYRC